MKLKAGAKMGPAHADGFVPRVISVTPYNGRYKEVFDCVVRHTSTTPRGWTERAYDSSNWEFDQACWAAESEAYRAAE